LDVSTNIVLNSLAVGANQFSGPALNALFGTLHTGVGTKYISFLLNPGTATCDRSIATGRGWTII
jgi:hypothetical protein